MSSIIPLSCALQPYAWGKIGNESTVAKFAAAASPGFVVDPDSPYAELWMGTHPNGPSFVDAKTSLASYIVEHPEVLGKNVQERFDGLPFLFKVLSVGKSLSIQAHPDLELAKKLHTDRPDVYKDPNHKPEICIALTPFEALCGFRPMEEIVHFIDEIESLRTLLGDDIVQNLRKMADKAALKAAFTALMNAPRDLLDSCLSALKAQLLAEKSPTATSSLALRISEQFPGDVGCFSVYFLNYVTLNVGEGLFLGPNEAHAYLSGDCIECMAASDNVVRAGLTPKFIDVPVLCSMLTYSTGKGDDKVMRGEATHDARVYRTPADEFDVEYYHIDFKGESIQYGARSGPSIVIVVDGSGTCDGNAAQPGSVFFVPANRAVELKGEQGMTLFRAFCEI